MSKNKLKLKSFNIDIIISALALHICRARGYDSNVVYNAVRDELLAEIENDKMDIVKCMKLYGRITASYKTKVAIPTNYNMGSNPWNKLGLVADTDGDIVTSAKKTNKGVIPANYSMSLNPWNKIR